MPIAAADLSLRLSVTTGLSGNSTAGTPDGALGKYVSTTVITDATLNNLFDDVTSAENVALTSDYRCIFIHNAHPTLTLQSAVVWMVSEIVGGASIAISVDSTAASAAGSSSAQAKEIVDQTVAPAGQVFSSPGSKASGLALGNVGPGQVRGIWIRRNATNSVAFSSDGATIRVEGETSP